MMKSRAAVALTFVSAVVLAGCTRNLDMEIVKSSIRDMVVKQIGANVKSVTCPETRPLKAGDTFECQVEIDHGKTAVSVTQTDDAGNINMKTPQLVLKVADLEKLIAGNIKQGSGLDATVDCGPKFRPSIPNDTFDCQAKAGEQSSKIKVTVKDGQGNVTFATVPDPAAADTAVAAEEEGAE
jgi:hypothetical protein